MARLRVDQGRLLIEKDDERVILGAGEYKFVQSADPFYQGDYIEVRRFYQAQGTIYAYTNQGMVKASIILDHCDKIN